MEYFTVLTNIGAQKIAAATAANSTINLSEIAVGDGNGVVPTPNISQEALVNEKFRAPLSELTQDEVNKNHFIARSVVPADNGNFWIREIGIYDVDGDLIAVGNYPETYKSILTDGAAKEVDLIVVFEVANADVVKLEIDPTIVMASQDYVNQKVATKADKNHNHDLIYAKLGGSATQKFKVKDAITADEAVNKLQMEEAIKNIDKPVIVQQKLFTPYSGDATSLNGTIYSDVMAIEKQYDNSILQFEFLPNISIGNGVSDFLIDLAILKSDNGGAYAGVFDDDIFIRKENTSGHVQGQALAGSETSATSGAIHFKIQTIGTGSEPSRVSFRKGTYFKVTEVLNG